jgi:predicted RNA-binding protein with PIN domain
VAEPTLYLFDGYNLLHAGRYADRRALTDALASFVALKGARGVLVWDGAGEDGEIGAMAIRYAPDADSLLERLAAEHRERESVLLVSSDAAVRGTSGQEVQKRSSAAFAAELDPPTQPAEPPTRVADALDAETRARLERLRRGG